MDAPEHERDVNESQEERRDSGPRGRPGIAWIFIVLFVGAAIVVPRLPADPAEAPAEPGVPIGAKLNELQARVYVVLVEMSPERERAPIIDDAEGIFNRGSVNQRQRFIPLIADLDDPNAARRHLQRLDEQIREYAAADPPHRVELTEEEAQVMQILRLLYVERRDETEPPRVDALDQAQRDLLKDELGWFGELALVPRGVPDPQARAALLREARFVMIGAAVAMLLMILAVLAGTVGLIVFLVFVAKGRVRSQVQPTLAPNAGAHHGIYAETFALWLAAFSALSITAANIARHMPEHMIFLVVCGFFLSLLALTWPVVRGVSWRTVRSDIGLHLGRRPALEPFTGAAGYLITLPMFAVGLMLTIVLFGLETLLRQRTGPESGPFMDEAPAAHPVLEHILGPDLWPKIQVYLLACVAAPIVEEIMFRGVFHRHLRGATWLGGTTTLRVVSRNAERCGTSIIWSTLLVSFIFAAIHPVPFVAIPALMSLAFGFTLLREWRGTLVPAMVAHAIHNGLMVTMVLLVLRV